MKQPGFWKIKENQKDFLLKLSSSLSLHSLDDWKKVTVQYGGSGLLDQYQGSLKQALKNLLSIHFESIIYIPSDLNINFENTREYRYWKSKRNILNFFEKFAKEHGINKPENWGNITMEQIAKGGGRGLLKVYNGSLYKALEHTYNDIEWKKEWFVHLQIYKRGFWKKKENQRLFLEDFAKRKSFSVLDSEQWGQVTMDEIKAFGGSSLFKLYGSLFHALSSTFPEIEWKKETFIHKKTFPPGYWKDDQNSKNFLLRLAKKFNIKDPKDWGKITHHQVISEPGGSSFLNSFNNSILNALKSLFPTIEWNRRWFPTISKYPKYYWNDFKNQQSFLSEISDKYDIKSIEDWKKISIALIRKQGGHGLLAKYNNSLYSALYVIHPFSFQETSNLQSLPQDQLARSLGFNKTVHVNKS